ncbi:MAG: nucleoside monophosphate kinase [bacterium]|nr:nucleoside monophosphate kinase [bacterium]
MDLTGFTFVFIGRSGCGKGTQAALLQTYLESTGCEVLKLGTGDFARERAQKNTLTGKWIKSILDAGGFFPHWLAGALMIEMIEPKLTAHEQVLLLDGSPRRMHEAEVLDDFMAHLKRPLVKAIHLDISEDECSRRLIARGRGDDTEDAIKNRLTWFKTQVAPVLDYYGDRLISVSGEGLPESIHAKIVESL